MTKHNTTAGGVNKRASDVLTRISENRPPPRGDSVVALIEDVEQLNPPGDSRDIERILDSARKLNEYDADAVISALAKQTKRDKTFLRNQLKKTKRRAAGDENVTYTTDDGRLVLQFDGRLHVDDAEEHVKAAVQSRNEAPDGAREPNFTVSLDAPVVLTSDDGVYHFRELNPLQWRGRVNAVCAIQSGDGAREYVDRNVVDTLYQVAASFLPPMPELVRTPVFGVDGNLILAPGWYEEARLFLVPGALEVPPVSPAPTGEEIEAAVDLIANDLLGDFPFLDTTLNGEERREPSQANAIAMILTPFMRRMIDGCTPVFFVTKPEPGTGGTLLATVPMLVFDGAAGAKDNEADSSSLPYSNCEDEMQKTLVAAIRQARSHMFFDDVKGFDSKILHRAVTSRRIGGRILGWSIIMSAPNNYSWIATGNNPGVGEEMDRRICWINLNPKLTKAKIRDRQFKHSDLESYIAKNRPAIIWAALTLIQAWIAAGRKISTAKLASFEAWAGMVGGVMENAGIEGFLQNRRPPEADDDVGASQEFVAWWWGRCQTEPTPVKILAEGAIDADLDVADGYNDRERRNAVKRVLRRIDGQVFEAGDRRVIVRRRETGYALEVLG